MKGKSKRAAKNTTAVINSKIVPEVKAEPTEEMLLQFGENEVSLTDISAKVKQSYQESDSKEELKDMKVYIKPEDNKAYYVINGEIEGSVDLV